MGYLQKYWKTSLVLISLSIFVSLIDKSRGQERSLYSLKSIASFIRDGARQADVETNDQTKLLKQYDFIVVGAGTAGCVLANRLTEISDWKVLLIEAGTRENLVMDIPLLSHLLQFSNINWKYKSNPSNSSCLGFKNRQCNWPRGKVMGGSSVINYMIYTRGNRRDYDEWEQMGNHGWGWRDVLPYFKKIENFNIDKYNDPAYHSNGGYLNIGYSPYNTIVSKQWIKATQRLGFRNQDHNGKHQAVVDLLQLSMKNGTRQSSNRAYIYPIKWRNNLHVIKDSLVTKLLFDKKNNVIGVSFLRHNKIHKIYARKEVIVSAGAINSPQLLLLSGIGPKADLKKIGIPVKKNLMVGHNLMDHISAGGLTFTLNRQNISLATAELTKDASVLLEWMNNRNGPLSVPGGSEAIAFFDSKKPYASDGWPDLELYFIGSSLNADPRLKDNFNFRDDFYKQLYGHLGNQQSFMVFPILLKPKSKGKIMLRNKNPLTHPILISNYFAVKEDMDKIVLGIKESIKVSKQEPLKSMGTKLYSVPIKDCKHLGFGSDEYWACHAKHITFTMYHQSGTCKMGPKSDPTSVVDSRLKVHGIKGLRVVDASIMPEIPSAHINSPTYMIAEKGADLIKQDWGRLW